MDYLDLDVVFHHNIPEDKILTMKSLKEAGIVVPTELAYKISNLEKWDIVEPMIEEERSRIMGELSEESQFNTVEDDI
jgi:hypothetical protein